jgi:Ni,Fe-hydrogenase III large subunit
MGLERFKAKAEKIMDSLNVIVEGGQTADDFDKERQLLYAHIESLNEQVRQVHHKVTHIPVLKQRVEDQATKIEAKTKKIAEYAMLLAKSQNTQSN